MLLLVFAATQLPWTSNGQTASARMWCWSLRFHQGEGPFDLYSLDLTTAESGVNGELGPLGLLDPDNYDHTHWAWINLNDEIADEVVPGIMNLNIPDVVDSNGDGFDDFFDVTQAVSAQSSGIYQFDVEGVTRNVNATWNRAAGSAVGTCVLALQGFGDFTHVFELLEYRGTISYMPSSLSVSGTVLLTNSANSSETFRGPVTLVKSVANPSNLLRLQAGHWTNAAAQSLPFAANNYFRDAGWPTNYYGYFDFDDDGDIETLQPYGTWYLSIDDLNDADGDGVPNFSDTPPPVVNKPDLDLGRSVTNLVLTISGDVGRTYEVQGSAAVRGAPWQMETSVTLTNNPQSVPIPLPIETRFWRVLVK